MTILKLFHKKEKYHLFVGGWWCLPEFEPGLCVNGIWAPQRRKNLLIKLLWVPASKDPTNPCPSFSPEFINYYRRFDKPPPPLSSGQASVFSLTSVGSYRRKSFIFFSIITFWSLRFRNIKYKQIICIFLQVALSNFVNYINNFTAIFKIFF